MPWSIALRELSWQVDERSACPVSGKAFCALEEKTVLQRLLEVYRPFFAEIRIAARESQPYERYGLPVSPDTYSTFSSLNGIHTAISSVDSNHVFVTACDAPLLQSGLVNLLLSKLTSDADIVVPPIEQRLLRQPLCAIYSKRCLPFIAKQLERGEFQIIRFFPSVQVVSLSEEEIRLVDPELDSFTNINNPKELKTVVLSEHRKSKIQKGLHASGGLGHPSMPHSTPSRKALAERTG